MSQETFHISDSITTAREMREALGAVANILREHDVITNAGHLSLMDVVNQLRRFKDDSAWQISIERESPVEFEVVDKIYKEVDPVSI